jgi:polysaccharide export outer membrane protein
MTVRLLGLLVILLVSPPAEGQTRPAPAAAYRVGPGDVLEITVAGRPELARLPTVQTDGVIWIPRLAEVKVEGLTAAEIGRRLTELLGRLEPARPVVTVAVREYRSRLAWVRGEVNKPGHVTIDGGRRLVDVLLEAGGFTARASGEVLVERRQGTFPDGGVVRRFRIPRGDPTTDSLAELETVLEPDDVVTASAGRFVTVKGAVVRPGRYLLAGEVTVTAAISHAGGTTRSGIRRVSVSRRDPASGQVQLLQADLEAIEKGREPDLLLLPDDQIDVKARL